MKKKLSTDARYYEPYIIHDDVTVFDKNNNEYINRRRSVGISFSEDGKILISHAICSEKDPFDKKKGATIVRSRIDTALKSGFRRTKNVFLFNDLQSFNTFVLQFDTAARLFFVPFEIVLTDQEGAVHSVRSLPGKCRHSESRTPSESYFNSTYINQIYAKFFSTEQSNGQTKAKVEPVTTATSKSDRYFPDLD